jgi:alpha-D-ribose 1-methylphosphonate 5-triphosphate synthase subunit PhnG
MSLPSPAAPDGADDFVAARRAIMAICAAATPAELLAVLAGIDAVPEAGDLRPVESGLVMLRGRIGGDGRPFNFGEASVTRSAVALPDGRTGFAYQLGRDREKARLAAVIDALWQGEERSAVERCLAPVRVRLATEVAKDRRRVAATRVNFFTMVRGDG